MPEKNKSGHILIVALLALLVFAALHSFRNLDDNRLTSWAWVFAVVSAPGLYAALAGGIVLAWLSLRLPEPGPAVLGVLSFAVASVFWREPEVLVDASRYFTQAKHLSVYGTGYFIEQWGGEIDAWTDLPLVPFIYGSAFRVFGEARVVVQVITTAMFSATVMMTAAIGRELWDREAGLSAGALLMAMPYLYTQVPLMLVDVPSMFFLVLALYSFILALRRGGAAHAVAAALALFFALLSKYSLWMMLSVICVAWAVLLLEGPGRALRRGGLVFVLAASLAGAFVFYKLDVVREQIGLLLEYQRPGLGRWGESFTSTLFFQVHPFVTLGALYSVFRAARDRDPRFLIVLFLPALMALVGVRRIRYVLPVFPMLALMAGYGLAWLKGAGLRRFVVSVAVVSSVTVAALAYLPFLAGLNMQNLKDAGRFINGLDAPVLRVATHPIRSHVNPAVAVPILDIFVQKRIAYDYEGHVPPEFVDVEKSALRFSWRYKNPAYYMLDDADGEDLVAVISGERPETPEGYEIKAVFDKYDGIFRFKTFVTVFQRRGGLPP